MRDRERPGPSENQATLTLAECLKPRKCKLSDRSSLSEPLSHMDVLQNVIFLLKNTARGFRINTNQHSRNTPCLCFSWN